MIVIKLLKLSITPRLIILFPSKTASLLDKVNFIDGYLTGIIICKNKAH